MSGTFLVNGWFKKCQIIATVEELGLKLPNPGFVGYWRIRQLNRLARKFR